MRVIKWSHKRRRRLAKFCGPPWIQHSKTKHKHVANVLPIYGKRYRENGMNLLADSLFLEIKHQPNLRCKWRKVVWKIVFIATVQVFALSTERI